MAEGERPRTGKAVRVFLLDATAELGKGEALSRATSQDTSVKIRDGPDEPVELLGVIGRVARRDGRPARLHPGGRPRSAQ
jgi:hypothetical protein